MLTCSLVVLPHRVASMITFVPIIGNIPEVQKVRSYCNVIHFIWVTELNLHAFAQWWKHLSENNLLIPDGLVAALLDWCFPLESQHKNPMWSSLICGTTREERRFVVSVSTYLLPSELNLYVRINQVLVFSYKSLFDIGHDAGVHSGEALCSVDLQVITSPLSLCRNPLW